MHTKHLIIASLVILCKTSARLVVAQPSPEDQLYRCLASPPRPATVDYSNFVQGKPERLLLHKLWHSSKNPNLDIPLTIFTTSTAARLDQLKSQCQHWPGKLSAALYVPVRVAPADTAAGMLSSIQNSRLAGVAANVDRLLEELHGQPASCVPDVMLLYELIADDALMDVLPINQLRNYAMLQARTELVAMIDVDLLPSASLAAYLRRPENMAIIQHMCQEKVVVVIPAFQHATQYHNEPAGHQLASDMAAVLDKEELRRKHMPEGLVYQFHGTYFRKGHDCTNYSKWLQSTRFYSVRDCWAPYYEPWFIVNRRFNKPYDSVFRGFGWNKQTQVAYLYHEGLDFQVIPDGFLVHRQHETSASRRQFASSTPALLDNSAGHMRTVTTRFQQKVMQDLRQQSYSPKLDDGFTDCIHHLTWWLQPAAVEQHAST